MEQGIYVHEITLTEKDEFSKRFNYVSWLWRKYCLADNNEEQDKWLKEHFDAKLALEQGYPISFLNEYQPET